MTDFCKLLVAVVVVVAAVTAVVYQPIKKPNQAIRPSVALACAAIVINLVNCFAASILICPVHVDFLNSISLFPLKIAAASGKMK